MTGATHDSRALFEEAIARSGLSLRKFADTMGRDERTLRRWRTGQNPIPEAVARWLRRNRLTHAETPTMPRFALTVDSNDDAMANDPEGEVVAILEDVATRLRDGGSVDNLDGLVLRDSNGNEVGSVKSEGRR